MDGIIVLNSETPSVQYLTSVDPRLAEIISMVGAITYIPYEDPYEFLLSQIVSQMLSKKVAEKLFDKLSDLCEGVITPQSVYNLSSEQIKSVGLSKQKVGYIKCLTETVINRGIDFSELPLLSDAEIIERLKTIRGIGNWSAKMYLIFVLNRQDVLPYEDGAFLQSYKWAYKTQAPSIEEIQLSCKKWSPYSSIAARYLYRALDTGLTKIQ